MSRIGCVMAMVLVLGMVCGVGSASAALAEVPAGGRSMLPEDPVQAGELRVAKGYSADAEVVKVQGPSFDEAVRLHIDRPGKLDYDAEFKVPITGSWREGDVALLRVWMRAPAVWDEGGEGVADVYVQRRGGDWQKVAGLTARPRDQWQRYDLPFSIDAGKAPEQSELTIQFAGARGHQTLEVGGIELLNYGSAVRASDLPRTQWGGYEGRDPNAPWRAEAAKRIEQHRKGDLTVHVRDAAGNPVPDATVHVEMLEHAFRWGTAVTGRLMAITPEQMQQIKPTSTSTRGGSGKYAWKPDDPQRFRDMVEQHFNEIVFENDFKPGPFRAGESNDHNVFRHEWLLDAMQWLESRGITQRGHFVEIGIVGNDDWERAQKDPDGYWRDMFAGIEKRMAFGRPYIDEWDVVNHIVGRHSSGKILRDLPGGDENYARIIRFARQHAPEGTPMWVNEGQVLASARRIDEYEEVVRYLVEQGGDAAPDGVGFMSHIGRGSMASPEVLYERLDRFAKLVPQLKITELDIGHDGDEQLHADYMRDFLTTVFSHPAMTGVVQWGFWDGKHWLPGRGLWREDWSIRPAGEVYLDLIHNQWWTDETGKTDEQGEYATRGFLGDYRVTVTGPDGRTQEQTLKLTRDGSDVEVVLE